MVEIKKLPPGEAIGARNLQRWATNRQSFRGAPPDTELTYNIGILVICGDCGSRRHQRVASEHLQRIGIKLQCSKCASREILLKLTSITRVRG